MSKALLARSVQGSIVSETLDRLSKELLRFQEERRIAVMVKMAERDRQDRQAIDGIEVR